jgi:hypothetical protein
MLVLCVTSFAFTTLVQVAPLVWEQIDRAASVRRLAGTLPPVLVAFSSGIVNLTPDPGGIPGASAIQSIANGLGWWALLLSLLGLVIGAATWALGSHSNNYQYATSGRRAVVVSGLAALVIGAAPALINFFFSAGQKVS